MSQGSGGGGVLQECYVTTRGYQLERDKLLHGGGAGDQNGKVNKTNNACQ